MWERAGYEEAFYTRKWRVLLSALACTGGLLVFGLVVLCNPTVLTNTKQHQKCSKTFEIYIYIYIYIYIFFLSILLKAATQLAETVTYITRGNGSNFLDENTTAEEEREKERESNRTLTEMCGPNYLDVKQAVDSCQFWMEGVLIIVTGNQGNRRIIILFINVFNEARTIWL